MCYSNEANFCIMRVKEGVLKLVSFYRRQLVLLVYFKGKMCNCLCHIHYDEAVTC